MPREVDPAARVEAHALAFEERALEGVGAGRGARAHLAARVHDAVPGEGGRVRQCRQRVAHQPRLRPEPGQPRHLPVGGHPPARDAPHDGVDAGVGVARAGGHGAGG